MTQSNHQSQRREFLLRIGAVAGSTLLVPFIHGCESTELYTLPPLHVTVDFNVANSPYTALKTVGSSVDVSFGNVDGVLVRVSEAEIIGVSRVCPHQQGNVTWDNAAKALVCATHKAKFANTGAVVTQPNNGDKLTTMLPAWQVTFDAATGKVTVKT